MEQLNNAMAEFQKLTAENEQLEKDKEELTEMIDNSDTWWEIEKMRNGEVYNKVYCDENEKLKAEIKELKAELDELKETFQKDKKFKAHHEHLKELLGRIFCAQDEMETYLHREMIDEFELDAE